MHSNRKETLLSLCSSLGRCEYGFVSIHLNLSGQVIEFDRIAGNCFLFSAIRIRKFNLNRIMPVLRKCRSYIKRRVRVGVERDGDVVTADFQLGSLSAFLLRNVFMKKMSKIMKIIPQIIIPAYFMSLSFLLIARSGRHCSRHPMSSGYGVRVQPALQKSTLRWKKLRLHCK